MSNNTAAIITAAGFSSRMKSFKPLLPLGSSTIIETAIDNFKKAGVNDIVVITGNNGEALKKHIAYTGAVCLDSDYARNTMFDSACIGLSYLKDKYGAVFFTPVDAPLFTSYSIKQLRLKMKEASKSVLCPCYEGSPGHPLLINADIINDIISYNGDLGMKGAVESLKQVDMVELPDPALIMDADTPADYEALNAYFKARAIPSTEYCMKLHSFFSTSEAVLSHCLRVASVAEAIANALDKSGYELDIGKIKAGALMHDILRHKPDHANEAARLLEDLMLLGIADIVRDHMELENFDVFHVTEKSVVYLADKLVSGNSLISLDQRFAKKLDSLKGDKKAYCAAEKRFSQAVQIRDTINIITRGKVCKDVGVILKII